MDFGVLNHPKGSPILPEIILASMMDNKKYAIAHNNAKQ